VAAAASRDSSMAASSAAEKFSQPHHFLESVVSSTHNRPAAAITSPVSPVDVAVDADIAPVSVAPESGVYANATTAQSAPIMPSVVYRSLKHPQVRLLCALLYQEQNESARHCQLTSHKKCSTGDDLSGSEADSGFNLPLSIGSAPT
jgi:hypothetical protein